MTQPYLGEVRMFGGNYAPRNWAMCNGQILPIQQNSALFSLLGTTYGGNGVSTFQLPNLQSRIAIGQGNGPSLTPRVIGEIGGEEQVSINVQTMPQHNHMFLASTATSTATKIANNVVLGQAPSNGGLYAQNTGTPPPTVGIMAAQTLGNAGQSVSHNNIMPYQCVTFMIALSGIFPSRN